MRRIFSVGIALAVAAPFAALAQSSPPSLTEIQSLRQEIEAMRVTYESRLQALEQRLMLAQTSAAPVPLAQADAVVEPAASPAAPTSEGAAGGANAFNPAMSLIVSGGFNRTTLDPATYHISGFSLPAGAEVGPGSRGFSLAESELGLAASIDPWLRGAANISLHPDNTVSVEEAFVQTTALTDGLSFKAGRFFSGVGYLNSQHSHTWDFVDNPLAYQALLGTQYGDDGVQLHWLAPTEQFIELGAELGRGRSFPGSDSGRNGAGMSALTAHIGGDVGDSNNWRAGVSVLSARATGLGLAATNASGNSINSQFSGTSRVWVLDGVWKWAPDGNATRINFKLQGEYLRSERTGVFSYDLNGVNTNDASNLTQSGWYIQSIYQFMPSWRVGLRTERLQPGTSTWTLGSTLLGSTGYEPSKNSLMFDFSPSEFSRVRLQFARDRARAGQSDNQISLQYQMSLGAHGAHSY